MHLAIKLRGKMKLYFFVILRNLMIMTLLETRDEMAIRTRLFVKT
jgi:hypothetical protein